MEVIYIQHMKVLLYNQVYSTKTFIFPAGGEWLRLEYGQLPENRQISKIADVRRFFSNPKSCRNFYGVGFAEEVYTVTLKKFASEYYHFYLETWHMRTDDAPLSEETLRITGNCPICPIHPLL